MQTQAIDNRAVNHESAQQRFRVEKFDMNVQDEYIQVRIASPVLKPNNYSVEIKNDKLRLKLIGNDDGSKPLALPLVCDFYLPKSGYNAIGKQIFKSGVLTLTLFKSTLKPELQRILTLNTA
ncbi:Hsp20/alpha crystallin family protein [uncultured Zobellia sp.]|uniref:Hsp20/alpha crystallin family protein n=1 Tax=uncultured Zobellia sp. TaxID=255433 RepID=UPI0025949A16|nr:Hsp20/alpha crystallin family protein [uncultured Zobellia sp.]